MVFVLTLVAALVVLVMKMAGVAAISFWWILAIWPGIWLAFWLVVGTIVFLVALLLEDWVVVSRFQHAHILS